MCACVRVLGRGGDNHSGSGARVLSSLSVHGNVGGERVAVQGRVCLAPGAVKHAFGRAFVAEPLGCTWGGILPAVREEMGEGGGE